MTPETRVFDYTLSRVRFFFDHKKLSYEDALRHIREDGTISEPVRQQALQLAQRRRPQP